jgi:hypothetical protein
MALNCFFCHGRAGPGLTREHLLSKPICDFLGIDRKTSHIGRVDGNTNDIKSVAPISRTMVSLPCASCNSGWMSDLENQMAALLNRWIKERVRLTSDDVMTLRRWMAKTHLVLCAIEGRSQKFMDDPHGGVIPDATLGRLLYEGNALPPDGVYFAAGIPIARTFMYGFGNPSPRCAGPVPVSARAATVSYLNLGKVQLWTLTSVLPPVRITFPPRLTTVRRGLAHRQLQTVTGDMNPVRATIDYGNLDLSGI